MEEPKSQIILYETADSKIKIDVRLEDETVWLTQEQIALLFGKSRSTITEHIGNVFKEGELEEKEVCRDFRHTTRHGAIEGKTQEKGIYISPLQGLGMADDLFVHRQVPFAWDIWAPLQGLIRKKLTVKNGQKNNLLCKKKHIHIQN